MKKILMISSALFAASFLGQGVAQAAEAGSAIPEMMAKYTAEGGSNFSAEAGKKIWSHEVADEEGKMRSCTTCHGADLTKPGKHQKTGKIIAPLAPSVPFVMVEEKDIPRFSKAKKIRKWFKRNCKWTFGRECTPQEKGDVLTYLKDL